MKSLLKMKRLPGILALGLVMLAVGAAGVPASASTGAADGGAHLSGLNKKQKRAKRKALKRCHKKKARSRKATRKKRSRCKRHVKKKYRRIAKKDRKNNGKNNHSKGVTKRVDLGDNYFAPGMVNLKVNDVIVWSWARVGGREPHNVSLIQGPSGVRKGDYRSTTTANTGYRFKRGFIKSGTYDFVCTLHRGMSMTVKVSK